MRRSRQTRRSSGISQRLTTTLIIGAVAVAGLLVIIFVLNREPGEDADVNGTATAQALQTAPLFPESEADTVTYLRVEEPATEAVVELKLADDASEWAILAAPPGTDTGWGIDQASIFAAVAGLPGLRPLDRISEIEGLGTYGLANPRYVVVFTVSNGRQYGLYVGDRNPVGTSFFVTRPEEPNLVYLIDTFALDAVLKYLTTPPYVQPWTATPTEGPSPTSTTVPTAGASPTVTPGPSPTPTITTTPIPSPTASPEATETPTGTPPTETPTPEAW